MKAKKMYFQALIMNNGSALSTKCFIITMKSLVENDVVVLMRNSRVIAIFEKGIMIRDDRPKNIFGKWWVNRIVAECGSLTR